MSEENAKYQVYKDTAGEFRFRLRAPNNEIVAVGESYESKEGCMNGVMAVKKNCGAKVQDLTEDGDKLPNPKWEVFEDAAKEFRFRLRAPNGEIVAQSESYETKAGCMHGITAVQDYCDADIEDLTGSQPVIIAEPKVLGGVVTVLELSEPPKTVTKGQMLYLKGKLIKTGELYAGVGVENVKINILERDRSFFNDDLLAQGTTQTDGSFSIGWTAKKLDWWDSSVELYASFEGNEEAQPSKSTVYSVKVK